MPKLCYIAILGMPNVGKSTLLNALIGEKIAAVSPKAQTTRTRITGILTKGEVQYVFLDTPGILKAQNRLGEQMQKQIRQSLPDIDCALFVTEQRQRVRTPEREMLKVLAKQNTPVILLVNKCDTGKEEGILPTIAAFSQEFSFASVIPICAKSANGCDIIFKELQPFLRESAFLFEEDALTDQSERAIAAEFVREKLLCVLQEEVPHGIAVTVEEFVSERGHLLRIGAVITCEKASHKGIVIGKNGALLKTIGTRARLDLERFFGCKVNLSLWVRVKENWRDNPALIAEFGLRGEDA